MLFIITGNGKGKTTSAIGAAIRSAGWKKKTAIVFFDKGGDHYGEQHFFDSIDNPNLDIFRFGRPRFNEESKTFDYKKDVDDVIEAKSALKTVKKLINKKYFLIVCDEIFNCIELGFLTITDVKQLLHKLPKKIYLVFTGRNAPKSILSKADLISEVKEVKHYFRIKGETIKGVDY